MFLFIIIEFFWILHYLFVVIFLKYGLVVYSIILHNNNKHLKMIYSLNMPNVCKLFFQHLLNPLSEEPVHSVFKTC